MTLLSIVQSVLNDLDSDAVNAITDTEEALQVALMAKDTYYEMWSRRLWAHSSKLGVLESVSENDKPNFLRVPENVGTVKLFKYNRRKPNEERSRYIAMKYMYPDEFLLKSEGRDSTKDNVTVVENYEGVPLNIKNDKQPEYYTSFDDTHVVLDSWDKSVESTVQGKHSQVSFTEIPQWQMDNNFVPDLPAKIFPALLAEIKSVAFLNLKEEENSKAEQQSLRQQQRMSLEGWRVGASVRYPDYGRRASKSPSRRRPRIFGDRT